MYYKRRYGIEMGVGGCGDVLTSCGVRGGCCYNEDVASLKMLLRCKYRCCLQKGVGDGGGVGRVI